MNRLIKEVSTIGVYNRIVPIKSNYTLKVHTILREFSHTHSNSNEVYIISSVNKGLYHNRPLLRISRDSLCIADTDE